MLLFLALLTTQETKQSEFTTILNEAIELLGQYEVALAQMHYSPYMMKKICSIEIFEDITSLNIFTLIPIIFKKFLYQMVLQWKNYVR